MALIGPNDFSQVGNNKSGDLWPKGEKTDVAQETDGTIFDKLSEKGQELANRIYDREYQGSCFDEFQNLFFNEDGTLKGDLNEISDGFIYYNGEDYMRVHKDKNSVEIDYDNDGRYDQKAYYDEDGNKTEELFDTNGDGKIDTIITYNEEGNATSIMADEDYDGSIDHSETVADQEENK